MEKTGQVVKKFRHMHVKIKYTYMFNATIFSIGIFKYFIERLTLFIAKLNNFFSCVYLAYELNVYILKLINI